MISLADLPAPTHVTEVDLAAPLGPVIDCADYRCVRVLVRLGARPLGWITIEKAEPVVSADRLWGAILTQLGAAIEDASLRALIVSDRDRGLTRTYPPISVVVCTRDRPAELARCLTSFRAVAYPTFEVIVVDNAPTDGPAEALTRGFSFRYVREPRPGLDWARNRGIVEARHDIIAFADDEVRVDQHWLEAIAEAFRDPQVQLVSGLVAPAELETEAQIAFEYRYGGMGKGLRPRLFQSGDTDWNVVAGAYQVGIGANMAVRRELLEQIGAFDTVLDVGTAARGGGDSDLFHRALVAGQTVRYEPTALVWHYHRRTWAALKRQLRENGRAAGAYLLTQWRAANRRPGAMPRRTIARYAVLWVSWLMRRVVRRLLGRERLSLPLLASELLGLVESPWALWAAWRNDRRVRIEPGPMLGGDAPRAGLRHRDQGRSDP